MRRVLLICSLATLFTLQAIAQELNVASYNIRLHSKKDYPQGDGWRDRRDIMCDVIRFSNFDIFGAQEVCHDQLQDMLQRLPSYGYIGVGRDDGATRGEYSPIFYQKSRFELLDSGTFWLSETPEKVSKGWDAACRRVCSWGYFKDKRSKKRFWFFNTHMDHKGKVARVEGAKVVVAKIREMCGERANVILTGDFNVKQGSAPYKTFVDSGFLVDAYDVAPVKFAPSGTFNSFKVGNCTDSRIDHVFISKSFNAERYGVLTYHYWSSAGGQSATLTDAPSEIKAEGRKVHLPSDHYPVNVILTF